MSVAPQAFAAPGLPGRGAARAAPLSPPAGFIPEPPAGFVPEKTPTPAPPPGFVPETPQLKVNRIVEENIHAPALVAQNRQRYGELQKQLDTANYGNVATTDQSEAA